MVSSIASGSVVCVLWQPSYHASNQARMQKPWERTVFFTDCQHGVDSVSLQMPSSDKRFEKNMELMVRWWMTSCAIVVVHAVQSFRTPGKSVITLEHLELCPWHENRMSWGREWTLAWEWGCFEKEAMWIREARRCLWDLYRTKWRLLFSTSNLIKCSVIFQFFLFLVFLTLLLGFDIQGDNGQYLV